MRKMRMHPLWLVLLALLVSACSASELSTDADDTSPFSSLESGSPHRSPLPTPTPQPLKLVVLHTNDNWGETEPCG